jgi:hypothetical protein
MKHQRKFLAIELRKYMEQIGMGREREKGNDGSQDSGP